MEIDRKELLSIGKDIKALRMNLHSVDLRLFKKAAAISNRIIDLLYPDDTVIEFSDETVRELPEVK